MRSVQFGGMSNTRALLSDCTALPAPDPEPGQRCFAELPADIRERLHPHEAFLVSVFSCAPYLARLAQRYPDVLRAAGQDVFSSLLSKQCAALARAGENAADVATLDQQIRQLKAAMHLTVGLADLGGVLDVVEVTAAVTDFADAAVQAVLHAHVRFAAQQGRCFPVDDPANPLPGLVIFALGKMGTRELNYSSDIDLVVFYDAEGLRLPETEEPRKRLPRLVQAIVKSLNDITADCYVFRTDLRLRPDPGATPVIISTDAALNYYEAMGLTWERAAWIKARPCAGDRQAAEQFLSYLQPFIWRRALDYAAIDDIRSLATQIQTVGRRAEILPAGHDLKLGRGGIREIEFFAQIPQLVFGGRNKAVRVPGTLAALDRLADELAIESGTAVALSQNYRRLRAWEHRVQMRQDEATQVLPARDEDRQQVAIMAGFDSLAEFDQAVEAVLRQVHGYFSDQFEADIPLSSRAGSLVLTGVEPEPDTLATLSELGFQRPELTWRQLNAWGAGRARAVRSTRARSLFAKLAPKLVDMIAETGEADDAFARFASFFENLPMGVQPLSLLMNEPELAGDLIGIITTAPKMATELARRPNLLDTMLDQRFSIPLDQDPPGGALDLLAREIGPDAYYETALNTTRRVLREQKFRIGSQILRGSIGGQTAGAAFSDLADAAIETLSLAAQAETERKYGDMPGRFAVLGMGKLGGRELAADSDLDITIIYDGDEMTQTWFSRFTQRLVSALSVPTEEGELYEIDMQLRPSGNSGPVAVRFSRLEPYYREEAWTWEMMALTRARTVAGDATLCAQLDETIETLLLQPRDAAKVLNDAADMRVRLEEAKPARNGWDIKARPGGIQDIEFIAQALQLVHAARLGSVRQSTTAALAALGHAGLLSVDEARFLIETLKQHLGILQLLRTTHGSGFTPERASQACQLGIARSAGQPSLAALEADLDRRCARVRELFHRHVREI